MSNFDFVVDGVKYKMSIDFEDRVTVDQLRNDRRIKTWIGYACDGLMHGRNVPPAPVLEVVENILCSGTFDGQEDI